MTYNFQNCKAILQFDGKPYHKTNDNEIPTMFTVDNDIILYKFSDKTSEEKIMLVLNADCFQKYFQNFVSQQVLSNHVTVQSGTRQCFFKNSLNRFKTEFCSIEKIGNGGFGRVYSAQNNMDLQTYAVKKVVINCAKFTRDTCKEAFKEFRILAKLNHGNIVRYYTAWFEEVSEEITLPNDESDDYSNSDDARLSCLNDSEISRTSNSSLASQLSSVPSQSISHAKYSHYPGLFSSDQFSKQLSTSYHNPYSGSAVFDLENSESENLHMSESNSKENKKQTNYSTCRSINGDKHKGILELRKGSSTGFPKLNMALYIQMELCHVNLKDWLERRNNYPGKSETMDIKHSISLSLQLLKGIDYLHSNSVIHRDIKPANIFLVTHPNREHGKDIQLKIGDFGLAKSFEYQSDENLKTSRMTANVGTAVYSAPEVYQLGKRHNYSDYSHKCDMYSVGIILLELMIKFKSVTHLCLIITDMSNGIMFDNLFDSWPIEAGHVMNLLSKSPDRRPEAGFILSKTLCFKGKLIQIGVNDQIKELVRENLTLKQENELLRKEIEELRLSHRNV